MEILSTIWQITQTLLLITVIISSVMLLIALFHPLRFDVKLRGSVKGQRAEVWFVYLFRLFKIGVIATPHTQDLVVSFMGWKKRLDRLGSRKPASNPPPTTPSGAVPSTDTSAPTTSTAAPQTTESATSADVQVNDKPIKADVTAESPPITDSVVKSKEPSSRAPTSSEAIPVDHRTETADATTGTAEASDTVSAVVDEPLLPHKTQQSPEQIAATPALSEKNAPEIDPEKPETIEPVIESDKPVADIDSRPLKPLHEVEAEYKAAKDNESGRANAQPGADTADATGKATKSLKQVLRRFKRDASRRFNQFKTYARLFRLKWRSLSPVFKRFWQRGKPGFGLPRIDLLLRYALHEPYLTGMCHGTLAVASGMAGQWGVNFVPVPQFGAPMIYSRAYVTAVVRPWRLLYATAALLFEKQLYKEIWQLFKWYREKKQH
ncbi:MAG: hypothetical protein KKB51_14815 [Candidatus Riflebacteria bacterium]|nr:hypothetical protein [Candidatus Riflebacteria bacterium]